MENALQATIMSIIYDNKIHKKPGISRHAFYRWHMKMTDVNLTQYDLMTPHAFIKTVRSALVQVMACRLTAPSHYLDKCYFDIIGTHPSAISQKIYTDKSVIKIN